MSARLDVVVVTMCVCLQAAHVDCAVGRMAELKGCVHPFERCLCSEAGLSGLALWLQVITFVSLMLGSLHMAVERVG